MTIHYFHDILKYIEDVTRFMNKIFKSLKKKFKDKKFAAGCSRDVIKEGSEKLGWELNDLFEQTILAMRESEDLVNKEMEEI